MTAQSPDWIIYEGEERRLYTNPLDQYLEQEGLDPFHEWTTANWRGYVAWYAIDGGKLYLRDVNGRNRNRQEVGMKTLFPGPEGPVFAGWYTGELRLPRGKMRYYEHGGYLSIFEGDVFITVEQGVVTGIREVDNTERIKRKREEDRERERRYEKQQREATLKRKGLFRRLFGGGKKRK